jgi:hypothetical protein
MSPITCSFANTQSSTSYVVRIPAGVVSSFKTRTKSCSHKRFRFGLGLWAGRPGSLLVRLPATSKGGCGVSPLASLSASQVPPSVSVFSHNNLVARRAARPELRAVSVPVDGSTDDAVAAHPHGLSQRRFPQEKISSCPARARLDGPIGRTCV